MSLGCVVRQDVIQLEMKILERVGVAPTVEKMVENRLEVVWARREMTRSD
jgi:hypothetical protein